MFLRQCIPSITLHQVFVYRLAFCISVLLEASQNMPGSRPNIARRAAWTLDFVYDSTPKSFLDRGFQGRCHSLQFSHGEYQPTWHPRLPQVPCICLRALSSVLQENEIWVFLLLVECDARNALSEEHNLDILCSTLRGEVHLLTLEALWIRDIKPSLNVKDEYRSRELTIKF